MREIADPDRVPAMGCWKVIWKNAFVDACCGTMIGQFGDITVNMLKMRMAAVILALPTMMSGAFAAQPDTLGSIWREGVTDNKVWIVGTLRPAADLDQLAAEEAHSEASGKTQTQLHETFLRFEAECSDDDFAVRIKANAVERERPLVLNESPYSFEDSPLSEASVIVNGKSSLNLHYLWGAISGTSTRADDRLNLAGSVYRFLKQIDEQPKSEIKIYTPKGSASYLLDKSYQESANTGAITEFKQVCAKSASNWH